MKIGIWTDTNENLAAMKISAYHKAKGDDVERWFPFTVYDRIYACKIFGDEYTQLPEQPFQTDEIIYGGTGFDVKIVGEREKYIKGQDLPPEIEHIYPDYELYGVKRAIGFLSRGCPNRCPFCLISIKEGVVSNKVADVSEFWKGQKEIEILDPNLLACKDHIELLQQLIDTKAKINFSQGLDARFITDENAELLSTIKLSMVHFAMDLPQNNERVKKGLEIFLKHNPKINKRNIVVYVLTNFNTTFEQDYERINIIKSLGIKPDVRIYRKETAPRITRDLARWCNNRRIYGVTPSFYDYIPRVDGKTIREIYFRGRKKYNG